MGVDDLAALNASLAQATASRIEAQARYQQSGRAGASAEALSNSAINSLRQRRAELAAEYRRLMTQFEPGYPPAQAIQAQITQPAPSSEERRIWKECFRTGRSRWSQDHIKKNKSNSQKNHANNYR